MDKIQTEYIMRFWKSFERKLQRIVNRFLEIPWMSGLLRELCNEFWEMLNLQLWRFSDPQTLQCINSCYSSTRSSINSLKTVRVTSSKMSATWHLLYYILLLPLLIRELYIYLYFYLVYNSKLVVVRQTFTCRDARIHSFNAGKTP